MNMNLEEFFLNNSKVALGLSGGVDSAYLLYAGKKYGADVKPYYIKTAFQPQFEYSDVITLCNKLGVRAEIIEYDILSDSLITDNTENRCYYCKKALFTVLKWHAEQEGYRLIIDGTNASDDLDDRPGMRALAELGVRSPLRESGLGKTEIRELSKNAGLFTWDKPSYSCLATRTQTGKLITADILERIECSENVLMSMGFNDFRVRVYNDAARIQLNEKQFIMALNNRCEIIERIKPYFKTIFLDMEAR